LEADGALMTPQEMREFMDAIPDSYVHRVTEVGDVLECKPCLRRWRWPEQWTDKTRQFLWDHAGEHAAPIRLVS
jgi:hypothetical protein